jgi:hypothetical protein
MAGEQLDIAQRATGTMNRDYFCLFASHSKS